MCIPVECFRNIILKLLPVGGLTHCGLVTSYSDIDVGLHWLRYWLAALRHQAITWTNVDIFRWTLRKKFQWNLNRNSNIFIEQNASEDVVFEMAAILSGWRSLFIFIFLLKRHQPREQSSLNPAWCEATYWWLTNNCPLTIDLWILKTLPYFIIPPMAILPVKC